MFAVLALCVVAMAPRSAFAALVSASDAIYGAGALTRDTATGLEWLDLTQTQGLSVNDIFLSGAGGFAANGFRLATPSEVGDLWTNAGFVVFNFSTANRAAGELIVDLMGCTSVSDPLDDCRTPFDTQPYHAEQRGVSGNDGTQIVLYGGVDLETSGGFGATARAMMFGSLVRDSKDPTFGVYLVRASGTSTAVPMASTLILMAVALAGVGVIARCRPIVGCAGSRTT